jgi:16S rRNA (uracil1498-N3)-methyltransferase
MRSHWLADLSVQEQYVLKDESLHHLVNVIRIEQGEELLLINGAGLFVETFVTTITKRELRLQFKKSSLQERSYQFDLALGMPKREALELCLKEATELGIRRIYLIRSDFSQMRMPESERMEKLMVAALEQSNAPYLPEVIEANFESLPWNAYQEAVLLDSQTKIQADLVKIDPMAPRLLIVGPEGGFSPKELTFLHSQDIVKVVNLPTPILRTPTAVATGVGIMLQSLLK